MSGHELLDQKINEMHQVIAEILRQDPARLNAALAWIEKLLSDPEYSVHSKDALTEWREIILSGGVDAVLGILENHGENATRLPHVSPFAGLQSIPGELALEVSDEGVRPLDL